MMQRRCRWLSGMLGCCGLVFGAMAGIHAREAPAPAPASAAPADLPVIPGAKPPTPRQQTLLDMVTPEFLAAWDVDDGLERLIPLPTDPGNAADFLKNLEARYAADKRPNQVTVPADAAGVEDFLKAGRTAECRLVPDVYPAVVAGDVAQPDYVVIVVYARAALDLAERLTRDGRSAEAEAVFHATLNVGRHLTIRSPSLIVYMAGLSCKDRAAGRYARFLRDHRRHDESRAMEEYVRVLRERRLLLSAKAQVCLGEFQGFNCLHATARIALFDKSLFWRQEAVIRLGVLRWGAPNAFRTDGDDKPYLEHDQPLQALAQETLRLVSENDSEPSLRQLAVWSYQHLTPERFVELRHRALVVKNVPEDR